MTITELRKKVGLVDHDNGTVSVADLLKVTGYELVPILRNKAGDLFLFSISKKSFKDEMRRKHLVYVEAEIKSYGKLIYIDF